MTKESRFNRLYDIKTFETNVCYYGFKDDLEVGKEYEGVLFTPQMAKKREKGKEFTFNEETQMAKIDSFYYPISKAMLTYVRVEVAKIKFPVLKENAYVMLTPDIGSKSCKDGCYCTGEMVNHAREKEIFRVYSYEYCLQYQTSGKEYYVRYKITNDKDWFYVGNEQIIPLTPREAKRIIKEKEKELTKRQRKKAKILKELSDTTREKLIDNMEKALVTRGYTPTREALKEMVNEWFYQKYDLIKLLEKHPKWNPEKFMIQFDMDIERERDQDTIDDVIDWMRFGIEHPTRARLESAYYDTLLYNFRYAKQTVDSGFAETMKTCIDNTPIDDRMKPTVGTKSTRWINKIIKNAYPEIYNDELYNRKFAKFADAVNPLTIKRHTCLSLNPTDFLLQANGNSWRSCHYIGDSVDEAGCYCSGTVSYMLDKVSMVFYTVSGDYNGNEIEHEKKITRNMFAYEKGKLLQQRIYPQATDGSDDIYKQYRNVVQEIVAFCESKPNLWSVNHSAISYCKEGEGSTMYHDWLRQSSSLSSISLLRGFDEYASKKLVIGAKPLSIRCKGKYTEGGSELD